MPKPQNQELSDEVGAETEEDAGELSVADTRQAFVTGSDWTTETIVAQLRKGNIELNPSFQRREVWTPSRKSTLIESVVLNLPIPQIVLAERKDRPNTYIVLDGKQRLLTLRQFCADTRKPEDEGFTPLALQSLPIEKAINGKTYGELADDPEYADVVNAFDNHTIRTIVIRNWPDSDYLQRVFLRLNTGSVPLSPQELRQALIPGHFTDFLDAFASRSKVLHSALGIDDADFRMRDNEVLLRYFAFSERAHSYAGNLKRFLDETCDELNRRWNDGADGITAKAAMCESAITTTQEIFGVDDAFTTYNGVAFERRFNRAVFDIMTYYFSDSEVAAAAAENAPMVKSTFIDLSISDTDFSQSLTTTTKSKGATARRFVEWARALSTVVGLDVKPPTGYAELLE